MNGFKSWFIVCKYQPQTFFLLLRLGQACNHTSKLRLQG
jgi:hypothetical protein